MEFMKNGLVRILSAILGIGLLFAPVRKAEAEDFYLYGSLKVDTFTKSKTRDAKIQNIPEDIRNVPAHPDDLYKSPSIAPIPDSELILPVQNSYYNLELNAGAGFKKGIFDFKIGPKLSFFSLEDIAHSDDWLFNIPIKERNYLNHPGTDTRGSGAALTYYGLNLDNSRVGFGGSVRVSLSFDLSEGHKIFYLEPFIDYSAVYSPQKFFIETGWDRYNSLQAKDRYDLTSGWIRHSIEAGAKISFPLWFLEAYSRMEIPQILKTSLGNKANFTFNSDPVFSFGIRTGFSLSTIKPE